MAIDQEEMKRKFDTFFAKLKALEPCVDQINRPLKKDPQFHDLKAGQSGGDAAALLHCRAAYNLALAVKIAFETKSINIFFPAPMTVSKDVLIKDLSSLDPELMEIFFPVITFASENVSSLVPTGTGWVARQYINNLESTKNLIAEKLHELSQAKKEVKSQTIEVKPELTAVEKYQQKIAEIEQKISENAKECEKIKNELLEVENRDDDKDIATFNHVKNLAERAKALVDSQKLAEMRDESAQALAGINDNIRAIEEVEDELLEKIKNDDWQLFEEKLAYGILPNFDEEIADILNLSDLEKESWKKWQLNATTDESPIYQYFATKAKYLLGYVSGEQSTLTPPSILKVLKERCPKVYDKSQDLQSQSAKLHGQQKMLSQLADTIDRATVQAEGIRSLADDINEGNVKNATRKLLKALDDYLKLIQPTTTLGRIWAVVTGKANDIKELKNLAYDSLEKGVDVDKVTKTIATRVPSKKKFFVAKKVKEAAEEIHSITRGLSSLNLRK